jgi:hypothetical protein
VAGSTQIIASALVVIWKAGNAGSALLVALAASAETLKPMGNRGDIGKGDLPLDASCDFRHPCVTGLAKAGGQPVVIVGHARRVGGT